MRFVRLAIGAVIAISVVPIVVTAVTGLTSGEGALAGTPAGTLLELAPIIFVAGVLTFLFLGTGNKKD